MVKVWDRPSCINSMRAVLPASTSSTLGVNWMLDISTFKTPGVSVGTGVDVGLGVGVVVGAGVGVRVGVIVGVDVGPRDGDRVEVAVGSGKDVEVGLGSPSPQAIVSERVATSTVNANRLIPRSGLSKTHLIVGYTFCLAIILRDSR